MMTERGRRWLHSTAAWSSPVQEKDGRSGGDAETSEKEKNVPTSAAQKGMMRHHDVPNPPAYKMAFRHPNTGFAPRFSKPCPFPSFPTPRNSSSQNGIRSSRRKHCWEAPGAAPPTPQGCVRRRRRRPPCRSLTRPASPHLFQVKPVPAVRLERLGARLERQRVRPACEPPSSRGATPPPSYVATTASSVE